MPGSAHDATLVLLIIAGCVAIFAGLRAITVGENAYYSGDARSKWWWKVCGWSLLATIALLLAILPWSTIDLSA